MSDGKKPGALIAIAFGKPKSGSPDAKRDESPYADVADNHEGSGDDGERAAFDDFADAAMIPKAKRDGAYDALRSMIRQCLLAYESEEDEEDHHAEEESA